MARPEGFEPPTPWFEARYSIQLSYGRVRYLGLFMIARRPRQLFISYHHPASPYLPLVPPAGGLRRPRVPVLLALDS